MPPTAPNAPRTVPLLQSGCLWAPTGLRTNAKPIHVLALAPRAHARAGDISHDLRLLRRSLELLRARYDLVMFVPGNHEAWVRAPRATHVPSTHKTRAARMRNFSYPPPPSLTQPPTPPTHPPPPPPHPPPPDEG